MMEFQKFMKYFAVQANDNLSLLKRLAREYDAQCRTLNDDVDREFIRRLARE